MPQNKVKMQTNANNTESAKPCDCDKLATRWTFALDPTFSHAQTLYAQQESKPEQAWVKA